MFLLVLKFFNKIGLPKFEEITKLGNNGKIAKLK